MPDTDPSIDQQVLNDLYRINRIGWAKLLAKFGLPANIGIVRSMTIGQAKEHAAKHAN